MSLQKMTPNATNFAPFVLVGLFVSSVLCTFGGNEDKFVKKYATMKIYESCFGSEVIKQIRKEMKMACLKCASYENSPTPTPTTAPPRPSTQPSQKDDTVNEDNNIYAPNINRPFDADKVNPAILAYRPANAFPLPSFRPYAAPNFYSGFPNQGALLYQASFQPQQLYGFQPYNVPLFGQPYYGGQRTARDMDVRSQIDSLTSKMTGRVKNVTCVMQELGYLNDNLEPNFEKIRERIGSLPVSEELRSDMREGVNFCQQFSQCVPDINKENSPLSREFIRPMFFFKCYKHKKLEACIMKDIREKYSGVLDEDFDGAEVDQLRRTGKSIRPEHAHEADFLAASTYDFLYGGVDGADYLDGLF